MTFDTQIATILGLDRKQVSATTSLLADGATIPFISRYRKERTGGLDEVAIGAIKDWQDKLSNLAKRKASIIESITKSGQMTDSLRHSIDECWDADTIEDIYLPFKTKAKTKASVAREHGLTPLAKTIMARSTRDLAATASRYLTDKVTTTDEAIEGAGHIIAEWMSENKAVRDIVRDVYRRRAHITSRVIKGREEDGDKYKDYFSSDELLSRCASHRLLAMMRGEKEKVLKLAITDVEDESLRRIFSFYRLNGADSCGALLERFATDAFRRLIKPSIDTETINNAKDKAEDIAIGYFAANTRQLLLAPPLGEKRVMAIDPGFRTGCKVVCLDGQGNLTHHETIFPNAPRHDKAQALKAMTSMVERHRIDAIAIGSGTASHETETFVRSINFGHAISIFIVDEHGASIYSASDTARDEFPGLDVTVRGAISIGRRLMDPLAELIKIDPKSIGVGQYQYDIDQMKLKTALDRVIESCVNCVGANANTASRHLLAHISGLGERMAAAIVRYRDEHGPFRSREDLKKVPRLGPKTYEQCAGFLRIKGGTNPLDETAIHPESYHIATAIAGRLHTTVPQLLGDTSLASKVPIDEMAGAIASRQSIAETIDMLARPVADPRKTADEWHFDSSINSIDDLNVGQELPGIVTNITGFGCFVDIGIKENGLIHISQLSDSYVKDPSEIVKLHQRVTVRVISIERDRRRIGLKLLA